MYAYVCSIYYKHIAFETILLLFFEKKNEEESTVNIDYKHFFLINSSVAYLQRHY